MLCTFAFVPVLEALECFYIPTVPCTALSPSELNRRYTVNDVRSRLSPAMLLTAPRIRIAALLVLDLGMGILGGCCVRRRVVQVSMGAPMTQVGGSACELGNAMSHTLRITKQNPDRSVLFHRRMSRSREEER